MRDILFSEHSLSDVLESQQRQLAGEINNLGRADFIDEAGLIQRLKSSHTIAPLELDTANIHVLPVREVEVDPRQLGGMVWDFDDAPKRVKANQYVFAIPFKGDADLFRFSPDTFFVNGIRGSINGKEVHIDFIRRDNNAEQLKNDFDRELNMLTQSVNNQRPAVDKHNSELEQLIRQGIEVRKAKFSSDDEMVSKLGFPVK